MTKKEVVIAILVLILVGISYRFFPHPANFSPMAAISLFSGFFFRRYFIILPIAIMAISDIFIGFYDWKLMLVVYLSFIIISIMGIFLRKNKSIMSIAGYSLIGSFLFFITTNFSVWLFNDWYAFNFGGLLDCYTMAIPFFKNTLIGDLFYASVIFGCYEILAEPKERMHFLFNKTRENPIHNN
jgi:hypothetical protein